MGVGKFIYGYCETQRGGVVTQKWEYKKIET